MALKKEESQQKYERIDELNVTEHDDNWANLAIKIVKEFAKEYRYVYISSLKANSYNEAKLAKDKISRMKDLANSRYYETLTIFSSITLPEILKKIEKEVQKENQRSRKRKKQ